MDTNLPAEGHAGTAPPPDAPTLASQPLQADAGAIVTASGEKILPIDRARQNERTLAPLKYDDPKPIITASPIIAGKNVNEVDPFFADLERRHAAAVPPSVPAPVDRTLFLAASDSDTPARGLPRTLPKDKQITGGFGTQPTEYFALNGAEVRVLVEQLLDELHARIQNDLRFSPAICYPRITAKLSLSIQCAVQAEGGVEIEKVFTHEKTPLVVAETLADQAVFVITQQRREADDQGQPETPSGALRQELDLPQPGKKLVGAFLSDVGF